MEEMDALEQMAVDLDEAQQKRLKKTKMDEDLFWANRHELVIFEAIRTLRENSRSYKKNDSRK